VAGRPGDRGDPADPGLDRAAVLRRVRVVAERTGASEAELDAINELLELVNPARDPLLVADLLVRRTWLRQNTGQEFAGLQDARRALELAHRYPDSPQYARAMAQLARVESWRGLPSGRARAAEAVAVARASGSASALTARENEILRLVVAGRTYREIARALVISEKTVSAHISSMLRKTSTASRTELAQKYRRLTATAPAG
jgi:DNA-binding CsgD family transcriptional regulator